MEGVMLMLERLKETRGALGGAYDADAIIIKSRLGYLLREMRKTMPEEEVDGIRRDVRGVLKGIGRMSLTESELGDVREMCDRVADRGRIDSFGLTGDAAMFAQDFLIARLDNVSAECSRQIRRIRKKDGKDKGVEKILSGYEFWEK